MSSFQDKVVLITGATSGIGKAAALAFAREGAKVVVSGRRDAEGNAVVGEIGRMGGKATFLRADVTRESDIKALVDKTVATYGRLDVAFNNAGIEGRVGVQTAEQTVEDYRQMFDINVGGMLFAMKHEIAAMLKTGGGAIVNTASVFSQIGMPGMALYTAAKHAIVGLTRAAALEYVKQGIRINAVSPGGVETEMFVRCAGTPEENTPGRQLFTSFNPLGRTSRPEEQVAAVMFLASDKASFVNGANLAVDSGWSIA